MDIEFENAKRKDVPVILQFIKELARYEKLEHEMIANEHYWNNGYLIIRKLK